MEETKVNWKEKAVARREENEALKKRLEELKASRDIWQNRFRNMRELLKKVKAQNKELTKELDGIKKKLK